MGANLGAVKFLYDITTNIESAVEDGLQAQVRGIKYHITLFKRAAVGSAQNNEFTVIPVFVQCSSGTLADSLNLTSREVSDMIAQACSDEFGFYALQPKTSTAKNLFMDIAGTTNYLEVALTYTFELPKHLLNVLNKSISTERDQDLMLALVIISKDSGTIGYNFFRKVDYTVKSKGIIQNIR
jgi:hypothetical protein